MSCKSISLGELESLLRRDLEECSEKLEAFFAQVRITPVKWRQSPWGVEGFWAVAVNGDQVLWYNDIEDGFNVSRFVIRGEIPDDEYWCNQDSLKWALPRLAGDPGVRLGPPEAIPDP